MKTIPLVLTFAVCAGALAAQEPTAKPKVAPAQELAKIVAVEEQERDLAKAETLYREALAGTGLSAEARAAANRRLGALLVRLGREQEAAPFVAAGKAEAGNAGFDDFGAPPQQEREREAALREKARELVAKVVADAGQKGNQIGGIPLFGIDPPVAEQLLWIGEPAVPEVIAALQAMAKANGFHSAVVRSLAAFVWRVGGARAEAFFRQAATEEKGFKRYFAEAACAAAKPEMMVVVEQYLRLPDPDLSEALLDADLWGRPLHSRLDESLLIDVLGRGSVAQRAWLLTWAMRPRETRNESVRQSMPDAAVAKLLPVIRQALASTEPVLGTAAQRLLANATFLQRSPEVLELLLEWLPNPLFEGVHVSWFNERLPISVESAQRLLPKLDACMRAVGPARAADRRVGWLVPTAHRIVEPLDATVVPQVLAWVDLGFPVVFACRGKVTAANAAEVLSRIERVEGRLWDNLLEMLSEVDLPPELFPALRAKADVATARAVKCDEYFAKAMARTGHVDAAPWLLSGWQASREGDPWCSAMLELGRRNREEPVRAALRTVLADLGKSKGDLWAQFCLALLAMHDQTVLSTLAGTQDEPPAVHPYAKPDSSPIRPLDYLLSAAPQPPHGFTEDEQLAFVRGMATWQGRPATNYGRQASDRVLMALVEGYGIGIDHAAFRIDQEQGAGPWRGWLDRVLEQPGPARRIVKELGPDDLARLKTRLDAALNGDDEAFARDVLAAFQNSESMQPDYRALLTNRHEAIRMRCVDQLYGEGVRLTDQELLRLLPTVQDPNWLQDMVRKAGEQLVVDAVPQLMALLRSPDFAVREAATQALTKIRFYHEQQAHWDRVLKGLDASPASAAEKLLLQAKPGAPKDQRLLAITSLGTLGVPEALPFLIEWTQDADAAVAKAAKAAITQIHLNPRK